MTSIFTRRYANLDNLASWLERIKNLFLWHQAVIAWAAVIALLLISFVLAFVGPLLKYLVLVGGYVCRPNHTPVYVVQQLVSIVSSNACSRFTHAHILHVRSKQRKLCV
jgi:hypothetical protein